MLGAFVLRNGSGKRRRAFVTFWFLIFFGFDDVRRVIREKE